MAPTWANWAGLPNIIKSRFAAISIFALSSPENFNFENPVATNPGVLVTDVQHPALFKLLSSLDIVMIWTLVLTGIGFSVISKVKRSTAMAMILGIYALIVLVQVGFKAI